MTDERWQLAYSIYQAAALMAESSRWQYVETAAPDAEIAAKVQAMLDEMQSTAAWDAVPSRMSSTDTVARPSLAPGVRLGPYEIHSRIGEGGMGVVYRARDPRLDRQVAIKLLAPEMAADPQARKRLHREAKAAAALDHPYICKIFEIAEDGDALFMVMEFIVGVTLHRRLQEGRMPLADAMHVAGEIAEALQEAHTRGLLHRDLKPSNVMLTEQGHVKVLDFGLAKRIADSPLSGNNPQSLDVGGKELTLPGTLLGTPDYMSPEQVKGLELDARSDMFSFGAILAEMISGRNPFRKPSMAETLSAVLHDAPDFGGEIHGGTTVRGLVVMARRMLAKDTTERYASLAELRADLARLTASSESAAAMNSRQQPRTDRVPRIGRDAEFKQLAQQLEEALAGRGSLILIGGEPGIGKTHLSSALLDAARSRGAFAIAGQCYEMEGSPPYVPFVEMLEHSARSLPLDTFRHALSNDAPEVARLMPELRQTFPDIPAALVLPPEQQRRFLFNAYRAFVGRLAQLTPIVALLEDLQWADEPTLLLLQHLAQAVAGMPMLIIATYRDVDLEVGRPCARMLESLLRQKLGTRVLLRRLPVAGVAEMLAALSAQQAPRSLARVVFEGTDGNPFFVEEVFRHLAEEGKLFDERGMFSSGLQVDQLQVPDGVRLVLGRRLQRLSEDARRILTTAAVIGRAFSLELLEALEKDRPDAALDAVEEAICAHLVETEGKGRQTRYRFVHELLRQTLSETLSLPRRQRLHARVAGVMERVYAASIDAHVSALAHHLYQAGSSVDQEKTIHFLSEAARHASRATAHEEALDHLGNAVSLLDNERTARTADLHARRAGELRSLSRNQEAVQEYERALALFDRLGDHVRFVETCAPLVIVHMRASQFQELRVVIDRAAQHAKDAPAFIRVHVLAMQANRACSAGDIDMGLGLLEELYSIPENELATGCIAFAAAQEMYARFSTGQWDLCEAAARKATRIFEQSGDVWSRADVEIGLFWQPLHCGQPAEAERLILEAIPRAERVGQDVAKSVALMALAGVYVARGDLERGERAAREALAFAESFHFGWLFIAETSLGGILLYRDQIEEALTLLRKASGHSTRSSDHSTHFSGVPEGLLALGMTAAAMEGAANASAAAMRLLPRLGISRGFGAWHAVLSMTEALGLSGRREEAGRLQVEAEKIAAEWDCGVYGFPARTAAGIAAASAGDWMLAEEHHKAAIARMDVVPYVTAQPIARYWYADMLADRKGTGDVETARALLKESIAAGDRIGLALYARLARQRLARIG